MEVVKYDSDGPSAKLTSLDIKKSDNVATVLASNHLRDIRHKISPRSKIPVGKKSKLPNKLYEVAIEIYGVQLKPIMKRCPKRDT